MLRKDLQEVSYLGGYRLHFAYTDGAEFDLDFWMWIKENQLLRPLLDPVVFAAFALGPFGRSLEWPEYDLGFCADSLWLDGHPEELAKIEAAAAQAARRREAVTTR